MLFWGHMLSRDMSKLFLAQKPSQPNGYTYGYLYVLKWVLNF